MGGGQGLQHRGENVPGPGSVALAGEAPPACGTLLSTAHGPRTARCSSPASPASAPAAQSSPEHTHTCAHAHTHREIICELARLRHIT